MTRKGVAAKAALKLYPPWWAHRYLEEAQAVTDDLIESGRPRWKIAGNLSLGALRARLTARGMPMEAGLWASRTNASIVLATAPALVVIPLMFTIRQVPAIPTQGEGWSLPSSHLATVLYLILVLAFVFLMSTVLWGYGSLSGGVLGRRENGRGLRMLARAPGYLTCLAVVLWVVSLAVEPHAFRSSVPLNGHPAAAHALEVSAAAALGGCWIASIALLRAVAHGAELPVASLGYGKRVGAAVSVLLWTMTGAALALSTVYSRQISELHGVSIRSTVLGQSLLLLGFVLCALAFAATLGAVLASRSWKVTSRLIG